MKKRVLLPASLFLVLSFGLHATEQTAVVEYDIRATLVPDLKLIEAEQTLTWVNTSDRPVEELRFHLYLNAFKNNRTTFWREGGGDRGESESTDRRWGLIEIEALKLEGDIDLTDAVEFIRPDDGNPFDETVFRVALPSPVSPRSSVKLWFDFRAELPPVSSRTGYADDFFMAAQWFPKIGVLRNGEWNCHQYHANSEFFSDFGSYRVEITLPSDYVVGATGRRIETASGPDGLVTQTYVQDRVHDFAWAASPDFVEFKEKYELDSPPVSTEMILLLHGSHLNQKDRYFDALRKGIGFFSRNYGPYPYSTITLVDPPSDAAGAGGMEYPTLFTGFSHALLPRGLRALEMVTIHEFGHQYWYGIVASNEFEEAWLDEGINTYSEIKAMDGCYGSGSVIDLFGLEADDLTVHRISVNASRPMDPILKNSWEYFSSASYGLSSYSRPGLTLLTLEGFLGRAVMDRIMRTYFERWAFKHPTSRDFFDVAEEVSGRDLDWFFDQFFRQTGTLDYAVSQVRAREVDQPDGFWETAAGGGESRAGGTRRMFRNEVVVERRGELYFPQEILITFENGDRVEEIWDGRDRWKRYEYLRPVRVKTARLDPEDKVVLDINVLNNSRTRSSETSAVLRFSLRLMEHFQTLLSFLSL